MSRVEEIRAAFGRYGTDKANHNYAMIYAHVPHEIKRVLEIGIDRGASLLAWQDIFPQAQVYGIDIEPVKVTGERIHAIQSDIKELDQAIFDQPFELIVDDGSHDTLDIIAGWEKLWRLCSGIYVIEDKPHEESHGIISHMRGNGCEMISAIQTSHFRGSTVIVGQFGSIIEW